MFLGSLIVSGVQITMVYLIIHEMQGDNFEIKQADEFLIVIPRLLSSLMMHLIVEGDIRNGISLMKYAVNHPSRFRGVRSENGKSLNVIKLIPPFALGFT